MLAEAALSKAGSGLSGPGGAKRLVLAVGAAAGAALLLFRGRAGAAVAPQERAKPTTKPKPKPKPPRAEREREPERPVEHSERRQRPRSTAGPPPALPATSPVTGSGVPCLLAQAAFTAIKRATEVANRGKLRALSPAAIEKFAPLFPRLDLTRVRFAEHAKLPANEIAKLGIPGAIREIRAMTFGYSIYAVGKADDTLIVHELVHVDQVRRLGGESQFACAYGSGVVKGGGTYHRNPLEREAYRFSDAAGSWLRASVA